MNIDWPTTIGMMLGLVWIVISGSGTKPVNYLRLERSYLREVQYDAPVQR